MIFDSFDDYIEKASNEYGKIAKWQYHPNRCLGTKADVTIIDEGIGGKEDMPVDGISFAFNFDKLRIGYSSPKIDKIRVNPAKNATTVLWTDGTVTVVKRSEDDPDNLYFAVDSAMAIKCYGSNSQFKKVVNNKTEYYEPKKKAYKYVMVNTDEKE